MYCTECGKKLSDDKATLCPECEAKLNPKPVVAPVVEPAVESTATAEVSVEDKVNEDFSFEQNKDSQPAEGTVAFDPSLNEEPKAALDPAEVKKQRTFGMGSAIAAVVMSLISLIIAAISSALSAGLFESVSKLTTLTEDQALSALTLCIVVLVMTIVAIGLAVPSLVFGIRAIIRFFTRAKAGYQRPIVAFILGIVAVVLIVNMFSELMLSCLYLLQVLALL